jgi:hypothetical protein
MKKKIIFLIVFVPVHLFLTMHLIQWYVFNYDADAHGLLGGLLHVLAIVLSQPIVFSMIITDLLEYWPIWIPMFFHILNSLIWALAILAVAGRIKRLVIPVFLMAFVPVHSLWTAILAAAHWSGYNPDVAAGLWGRFLYMMSFVFSFPVVRPLILFGKIARSPNWTQFIPYVINSFIWAAVIMLVYRRLKRLLSKKIKRQRLEPKVASINTNNHRLFCWPVNSEC